MNNIPFHKSKESKTFEMLLIDRVSYSSIDSNNRPKMSSDSNSYYRSAEEIMLTNSVGFDNRSSFSSNTEETEHKAAPHHKKSPHESLDFDESESIMWRKVTFDLFYATYKCFR